MPSLRKGAGQPIGFLAGFGGLPQWSPFLERLSQRHRVIAPSIPGFPGSSASPRSLDEIADWVVMTLDLLEASGLAGADLMGVSIGATLLAEAAAFSPALARRLVLVAPFGLQDEREPTGDAFARKPREIPGLFSIDPARYTRAFDTPPGEDPAEWIITQTRANETAARLLWPTGNRGLSKRLHRIRNPVLLIWGDQDRLVPASYAKRFADAIAGPAAIRSIPGAGHLADLDAPDALAAAVEDYLVP